MNLFPSTRTDYLVMNQQLQAARRRARAPRDLLRDRPRRRSSSPCCSATASPANSFMPPQVPFYDQKSPGIQYDMAKAKAELAKSKPTRTASRSSCCSAPATRSTNADRPDPPAVAEAAGHRRHVQARRTRARRSPTSQALKYQIGFSYWTMDIADPDELVDVRRRPEARRRAVVLHRLERTRRSIKPSHQAQREPNTAKRAGAVRADPEDRGRRRRSWASSTTRRSATPTESSCTASSSTRSATTTSRTCGSSSGLIATGKHGVSLGGYVAAPAARSWCRSRSASRSWSSS